jgi:LysR family hca operon transcriptional activator
VELRHLRYFIAVANELNFTRAAARLRTAQPSLSQQIRQLEDEVGVKLLERTRHRVHLTAAGRVFLRESQEVIARVESAVHQATRAARGEAGEVSLGTFPAVDVKIIPKLRSLVAARLPGIQLVTHSKYAMDPTMGLRKGVLDVAFVRRAIPDSDLEITELLQEPLVVVLPAHHQLARRRRIAFGLLDNLPYVSVTQSRAPALYDVIARCCQQGQIRLQTVTESDNLLGHLNLVQAGLGIALLPDYVSALLPPGVVVRPLDGAPDASVSIFMAAQRDSSMPSVSAVTKLIEECCKPQGRRTKKALNRP